MALLRGAQMSDITSTQFVLTPGEKFQNWLAERGFAERVRPRDIHQPEPPAGLWIWVNGAIAVVCLGSLLSVVGMALFTIPALVLAN